VGRPRKLPCAGETSSDPPRSDQRPAAAPAQSHSPQPNSPLLVSEDKLEPTAGTEATDGNDELVFDEEEPPAVKIRRGHYHTRVVATNNTVGAFCPGWRHGDLVFQFSSKFVKNK